MFNSERNESYGVSDADPIETTLTTKGYLSDGCRPDRALSINGGYGTWSQHSAHCWRFKLCSHNLWGYAGDDFFDVLRNRCVLDLNGESGDDSFTVRSFLLAYDADTEEWMNDQGNETLNGGNSNSTNNTFTLDGDDSFVGKFPWLQYLHNVGPRSAHLNPAITLVENPEELPDYVTNSLVDIDGGTGTNRLTIVGTEAGDRYVIQNGKVNNRICCYFSIVSRLWADITLTTGNTLWQ